jgi:lipoate-protein ligase A
MILPTCLRCLPSCTLPGTWQMAMDAWLLDQVVAGRREGPLLRFYRWSRPTLSLGKHQRALVLHGGDLTYALIWPDPPRQRREAYRLSCRWLQEAFAAMDLPLRFGETPCRSDQAHCFASSTAADLVHSSGQKRIGSAQLWRGRSLLQHGSVALAPDAGLWEAVFAEPAPCLPSLPLSGESLEAHLLAFAQRWFPSDTAEEAAGLGAVRTEVLQGWEWAEITASLARYELGALAEESSELSAMARASGSRASPRG